MENKINFRDDPNYCCKFWITESMNKLFNTINNPHVNFDIGLVECGYDWSQEEIAGKCIGWRGPAIFDPARPVKPNFKEHHQVLQISFKLPNQELLNQLEEIGNQILVTPSNNQRCRPVKFLQYTPHYHYNDVIKTKYHYKKNGFNEAFAQMKMIIPDLTEQQFANYDYRKLTIVSENELPDHELFTTETINVKEQGALQFYTVKLAIIATDIERNFEQIMQIFHLCNEHII